MKFGMHYSTTLNIFLTYEYIFWKTPTKSHYENIYYVMLGNFERKIKRKQLSTFF